MGQAGAEYTIRLIHAVPVLADSIIGAKGESCESFSESLFVNWQERHRLMYLLYKTNDVGFQLRRLALLLLGGTRTIVATLGGSQPL